MKKYLIPMTDFVIKQNKELKSPTLFEERVFNYAKFLKQPKKLGMFVPCDEDGKVLDEPKKYSNWINFEYSGTDIGFDDEKLCRSYKKAQEKVLFKGFQMKDKIQCVNYEAQCIIYENMLNENYIIEHLIYHHNGKLELTETAIKQIYG